MKGRTKLLFLPLLFVVALLFAGCSARSSIDTAGFQKIAEDKGFTISTESMLSTGAREYLSATKGDTQMQYLNFSGVTSAESGDAAKAKEIFAAFKASIVTGGNTPQTLDSETFCKYIVSNGDIHHYLVLNGATVIYGKSNLSGQSEMDQIFKDIKY